MPERSPQPSASCRDIPSVNPDRTCGHLIPGFDEKYELGSAASVKQGRFSLRAIARDFLS